MLSYSLLSGITALLAHTAAGRYLFRFPFPQAGVGDPPWYSHNTLYAYLFGYHVFYDYLFKHLC